MDWLVDLQQNIMADSIASNSPKPSRFHDLRTKRLSRLLNVRSASQYFEDNMSQPNGDTTDNERNDGENTSKLLEEPAKLPADLQPQLVPGEFSHRVRRKSSSDQGSSSEAA